MIDTSGMSEAHVQAMAAEQAKLAVRQLRWFGWTFAAVVVYGPKAEGGVAGASYFDVPMSHAYAYPLLAGHVRTLARDLDRAAELQGVKSDPTGDAGYVHTLGGSLVEARVVFAHMRRVDEAVLESVGQREGEFGELALACRAEQERRRVARATGAPER
jgi:hypothetical protein